MGEFRELGGYCLPGSFNIICSSNFVPSLPIPLGHVAFATMDEPRLDAVKVAQSDALHPQS